MEYPLTPAGQESAADLVQRIYLEGLWLPDVRESTFRSYNCTQYDFYSPSCPFKQWSTPFGAFKALQPP